jgi:hypothetical protein
VREKGIQLGRSCECVEWIDPKDERKSGKMRPNRSPGSTTKSETQVAKTRFVKRYRRVTTTRALKPWTPIFTLDDHEVTTTFAGGKLG